MRYPVLLVASLLTAGALCAAADKEGVLKQSVVLGRGSRLLSIQGMAPLPDGSVLVADKLDYRVKKLSSGGAQVATVGGRGTKPGQFRGPGPIDAHGDRIAVADHAANRIQILNSKFVPLATLTVEGAVSDLCFDGGGNLWVAAVTMKKSRGLFRFDPSGKQTKVLPLRNGEGDMFYDAGFVAWLGGGKIAFAYFVQNKIEIWDTSGRFVREFSISGLPLRATGKRIEGVEGGAAVVAPEGKIFRSMTSDGHGRIYLLISDYGTRPGLEIVSADAEGKECGRFLLPTKAVLIRSDGKDGFYMIPRERDAVVKVSLTGGE